MVYQAARKKAGGRPWPIQLGAKSQKYSRGAKNENTAGTTSTQANVNKVNDKVNDIYSIHSYYKAGAALGRATTKEGSLESMPQLSTQYLFCVPVRLDGLFVGPTLDWMDVWSDGRPCTLLCLVQFRGTGGT